MAHSTSILNEKIVYIYIHTKKKTIVIIKKDKFPNTIIFIVLRKTQANILLKFQ